jgi:hypothetical protein
LVTIYQTTRRYVPKGSNVLSTFLSYVTPCSLPQKLLLTNKFYFQLISGIHAPVGKRKGCSLSSRSPAPIADSFHVATMARKHEKLTEITRTLLLLPC